jgi:hypothetical protein
VVRAPCHPLLSGCLLTNLSTANNSFLWARFIFPFIIVFCILYLNHQVSCCLLPGCPHKHLGLEKYTANPANPIAPSPQHLQAMIIKCRRYSSTIMIVFWAEIYVSIYLSIYMLFQSKSANKPNITTHLGIPKSCTVCMLTKYIFKNFKRCVGAFKTDFCEIN